MKLWISMKQGVMRKKWGHLFAFAFACFFAMWSLVALLVLANPLVDKHAFSFRTDTETAVSDFVNFYNAAYMANSDQRTKIYDPTIQLEFTNRLIYPDRIDKVFYIQSVPYFFLLVIPLAMLPLTTAYAVWYGLSLIVGMTAVTLIIHDTHRFSKLDCLIILFAILSSAPAVIALKLGQTSWFFLCFLSLTYFAVKHRQNVLGGVSLALLTIKPQYIPLFLVSMLSLRRWKLLLVSFIAEALLLVSSGFTVGWKNIHDYPVILLHAETTGSYSGVNSGGMVSFRGILSSFLPQWACLAVSLIMLTLAAILAYRLWQMAYQKRLSYEWAMALTTVLSLVVSPHSHVHDLLLLSLPAVLTLPNLSLIRMAVSPSIWLKVWSFILVSYPLASWIIYCLRLSWIFLFFNFLLLISGLLHVYPARSSPEKNIA